MIGIGLWPKLPSFCKRGLVIDLKGQMHVFKADYADDAIRIELHAAFTKKTLHIQDADPFRLQSDEIAHWGRNRRVCASFPGSWVFAGHLRDHPVVINFPARFGGVGAALRYSAAAPLCNRVAHVSRGIEWQGD